MTSTAPPRLALGSLVWASMLLWLAATLIGAVFLAGPALTQRAVGGRETGMAAAINLAFVCLPVLTACELAGLAALVVAWRRESNGWQAAAVAHVGLLTFAPAIALAVAL